MKVLKNIIVPIICFSIAALVVSCDSLFMDMTGNSKSAESRVLIRLAGSDGRTIMPSVPVFSRYELTFQKGNEIETVNAEAVTGSGVMVTLSEGTWMITLNGYQKINGKEYIAAKGTYQLSINSNQESYSVEIELKPIPINDANVANGVFGYSFTLPNADTAVLSLKNLDGYVEEINLKNGSSGSFELAPGYYDMSVILTRDSQYAGLFEAIHIYSGLESKAEFDITNIEFAEKVYLAGNLGGIRIGTVKVLYDNEEKTIELERNILKRSNFWYTDIPASNIGKKVEIIFEFFGQIVKKEIPILEAKGSAGVDLNIYPASPKYINLAEWYSELKTGESGIIVDFGFDITANFFKVIYNDESSSVKIFPGTAKEFKSSDYANGSLPVAGFEIYNAADRTALIAAIETAEINSNSLTWNTTAEYSQLDNTLVNAQNVYLDPLKTDEEIGSVTSALNNINNLFPRSGDIWLSSGYSYSTLTANWTPAHLGDAYRVIYNYEGEDWITPEDGWKSAGEFERDADGNFKFTFKPHGYNENSNSGKTLYVRVLAINSATGDYIFSNEAVKRLVKFTEINTTASAISSADYIDVSWDVVEGAVGYHVSRRQFDMSNTGATGAITTYYVSANGAVDNANATASNNGNRLTLLDSTEADYAGSVSGYVYRYVVIPVINAYDIPVVNYENNSYTLKEKGEDVIVANLTSQERLGHSVGFAEVTASKGTYASSGNVNDGIRITWSKPARFADAGLQYFVYRRAYNGNWEFVEGPTGAMERIEAPSRGVMYEYAVSVGYVLTGNTPAYTPSQPQNSPRYVDWCRTKTDSKNRANFQGFMQNTVTMNNVTRGEDAAVNAVFGERVTWDGSRVAYGGSDINWGVDGYTVYVMNRNINANWHVAADNVTTNTILLTPSNTPSVNNTVGVSRNLLFVLRDYKHFFKARSYSVRDDGVKIYSPDPAWTYSYQWGSNDAAHITASNNMQNDFVKWGARQVTTNEFVNIAMLYVSRGFNRRVGNGWSMSDGTTNASTSRGGSGSVQSLYNHQSFLSIPLLWTFTFHNYKDDLEVRTGEWITFVRLTGQTRAQVSGSLAAPQRYWTEGSNWINVFGPATVADGLYKGRLRIGTGSNDSATNIRWNDNRGRVLVEFPLGSAEQTLEWLGSNTPLPFTGQGDDRYQGNAWR